MRPRTSSSRCCFHLSRSKTAYTRFTSKHYHLRNNPCKMPFGPRSCPLLWSRRHASRQKPVPTGLADGGWSNTRVDQLCWHSEERKMPRVCRRFVGWGQLITSYYHHVLSPPPLPLQVLQTNLKSIFLLSQAAGNHMVPLRRGKIINFCSLLTFQGGLTVPAYAAAKGGLGQLTKAMANEWSKENVQVNAICPGYIKTDM